MGDQLMQVLIKATSSMLDDDTIMIEVATTIGEHTTTQRCGYSAFELEHSRYISGTLEERIEQLRQSAQDTAEASFRAQYAAMLAHMQGTPAVLTNESSEKSNSEEPAPVVAEVVETPVKKTRKPRTAKPTTAQE
ncbi:hypothetical protein PssvBMR1_gp09 [Pseudomonas phage MR1]|uniref:Uncharacterized protein n=1 Tax=Pseudomonas phage MR1 TaxID=2711169 RepID=A0A6M3TC62_9CAUD|nr:hypothetical protein PssvBMR1_gp09 [Pseudomonas phage MR1]